MQALHVWWNDSRKFLWKSGQVQQEWEEDDPTLMVKHIATVSSCSPVLLGILEGGVHIPQSDSIQARGSWVFFHHTLPGVGWRLFQRNCPWGTSDFPGGISLGQKPQVLAVFGSVDGVSMGSVQVFAILLCTGEVAKGQDIDKVHHAFGFLWIFGFENKQTKNQNKQAKQKQKNKPNQQPLVDPAELEVYVHA